MAGAGTAVAASDADAGLKTTAVSASIIPRRDNGWHCEYPGRNSIHDPEKQTVGPL